ncbi:BRO family protein [Bifidobacterium tissieri]|uniref:Bro-N domain-containing protein n=1 Tax=Bifidobacterium tissieri TaxID=1630162 RepID=A0A5M9ZVV0_9BIFI|nr:BRO family protein [Bifidobacterium tissieri]KAA8828675.1 hypothetical protein EM849_11600 [Bifidobacterium tissieri]KAA8831618.1 hypothetical protein EMO89_02515 [Bifidobacterium tissieri]
MADTSLTTFDFNGSQLRTMIDQNGDPWFLAKDACDILGTETRDVRKILDEDEIANVEKFNNGEISTIWGIDMSNGGRAPLIVNESGLYALILRSRKPGARAFKRWVLHDVLPSIRKTGSYSTRSTEDITAQALTDPKAVAQILLAYDRTRTENQQLKAENQQIKAENTSVCRELEAQQPYADIGSRFVRLDGTITIRAAARNFQNIDPTMTMTRVFKILRDNEYITRYGSAPTVKAIRPGYLKQKVSTRADGKIGRPYAVFTAKGIGWFISRFISHGHMELELPTLI